MSHNSQSSLSAKLPLPGEGRLLSAARRAALYDKAIPEPRAAGRPAPASLTGQLRVLELQRDNLNRDITRLQALLRAEQSAPNSPHS